MCTGWPSCFADNIYESNLNTCTGIYIQNDYIVCESEYIEFHSQVKIKFNLLKVRNNCIFKVTIIRASKITWGLRCFLCFQQMQNTASAFAF